MRNMHATLKVGEGDDVVGTVHNWKGDVVFSVKLVTEKQSKISLDSIKL